MWAETLWNNENFQPIEKKEINYDDFLRWIEKSTEQMLQIRGLEKKDRKQEEQELNIYEQYFNWEISQEELKDWMLSIESVDLSQLEVVEDVLEVPETQTEELIETWREELEKQQEKLQLKISQLWLISDVSWMYKEYLQSILSNIKLQFLSNKDERFESQIDIIETQIRKISNIVEYLNLIWNTDELLKINTQELLDKLIVSEEKLVWAFWILDQPVSSFMSNKENSIDNVNSWYDSIKQTLSNPDISNWDIENIKVSIFNKIRGFDWLDDDKHRYNTSEAIRTRLTDNVLNNIELNKDSFVKSSFDLIKNFKEEDKSKLYEALDWWKENLNSFLEEINLFDTLWIVNTDDKKNITEALYNSLKEWKDNINDEQLRKVITTEVENKISYLQQYIKEENEIQLSEENKAEVIKQIQILEASIKWDNLDEYIENIKTEVIYKSFERIIISETLERKSNLVEQLSNNNQDINLYRDIEWIWTKLSDETFNSISSKTQFLAEQIAIMAISWFVWTTVLRWVWSFAKIWETTNLFKATNKLQNLKNLGINSTIEWTAFYLTYTWLNWLVNKKEASQLFEDLNLYDAFRTIVFLWVLRALSNTTEAMSIKNIALDTKNIIWTDIMLRLASDFTIWKEWIDWLDIHNLSSSDIKEIWSFLAEELEFIIPLVIWLRLSERIASGYKPQEKLNIDILTKENAYVIKIEWLQKDIRVLKQRRNIARKKWQNTSELNQALKEKKTEYQEFRDNPENNLQSNQENMNDMLIQETQANQGKTESKSKEEAKSKDSKAKDDVSTNKWTSSKYSNLEKYSKEVQEWKINYALKDWEIEWVLTSKWIWKDWKSVWEWLLKKSWFSKEEIRDYNKWKLKSEKAERPVEKRALKEMEKANEMIYKEYKNWITKISEWKNIKEAFPWLSQKLYPKIEKILNKDIWTTVIDRNEKM